MFRHRGVPAFARPNEHSDLIDRHPRPTEPRFDVPLERFAIDTATEGGSTATERVVNDVIRKAGNTPYACSNNRFVNLQKT